MIDDMNHEIEGKLIQAFAELKEMERKKQEKQDKKFRNELNVPFSLKEGLSKYTKNELDEIRKNLQIKNASGLKKAELLEVLLEKIPQHLEYIHHVWDSERFKLLTHIANQNGQMLLPSNLEDEQIRYFRATGLIYTGSVDGKKILAVPNELIDSIISLKNNKTTRGLIHRNTEWIKLTCGLLYYYGTLTSSQLINMVEKYTKVKIDFGEFFKVIMNVIEYREPIYIDKHGFSNRRVFDPERVKQEHQMRSSVPYYTFSKQQLTTAGEPDYVEKNKSYLQLVNYLVEQFEISKAEADQFVEECVYATQIGENPNDIMRFLSGKFEFESIDTVKALMDKVVDLMNNTREWFLKGYTSNELYELEKKHLQPLPSSPNLTNSESEKNVKVGRNDPCPCGSGKKYKKCCGR